MNGRNPPPEWPVVDDDEASNEPSGRDSRTDVVRARGGALSWTTMALIAGLIILVALVAYFATTRNPDQDKLTGEVATGNSTATDPSKLCASNSTYNLIKRDIFRRAAQVRGSDQATYDKLSNYAVLRMENPVMESQDAANNAVNCSGSLAIDLPPGLGVVGGRRTLNADVDYTVQPAADGSGNAVILRNADSIITPLATLARLNEAASAAPAPPDELNQAAPAGTGRFDAIRYSSAIGRAATADVVGRKAELRLRQGADERRDRRLLRRGTCSARPEHGGPVRAGDGRRFSRPGRPAATNPGPLPFLSRSLPEPLVHGGRLCRTHARNPRHRGRTLAAAAISRG